MRTWIVFSGGNGKGAYQAGALSVFANAGIEFDGAAGISIGAVNAAGVATDSIPSLIAKWKTIEERQIIKRSRPIGFALRLAAGFLPTIPHRLGYHDVTPFRNTVFDFFDGRKIAKPLYIGRVDLVQGAFIDAVNDRTLSSAIYRSCLMPIVMQPEVTSDQIWVDGGLHNITPLGAIAKYADDGDEIFVVATQRRGANPRGTYKEVDKTTIIDVGKAAFGYLLDRHFERDFRIAELKNALAELVGDGSQYKRFRMHALFPSRDLGAGEDYSRASLDMRFKLGAEDAGRMLDDIG